MGAGRKPEVEAKFATFEFRRKLILAALQGEMSSNRWLGTPRELETIAKRVVGIADSIISEIDQEKQTS